MGAYYRQNQVITDSKTWQDILQSGIATNYDLGGLKIGSDMLPGLRDELAKSIEELRNEGSSTQDAIRGVGQLFATEMKNFMQQLQARSEADGGSEMAATLQQMLDLQRKNNDINSKILQVSRG